MTHPFICRDEDGRDLWVKGPAWTAVELASEWICARLAQEWGLPLAECDLAQVPDELVAWSDVSQIASLGSGIGFASVHELGSVELDYGDIPKIDPELRADILLFDYWVHNADRILGEKGGNPNLLWVVQEDRLVMIDHNVAFDRDFSSPDFFGSHTFCDSLGMWLPSYRKKRQKKLLAILGDLPDILLSVPEGWFADDTVKNLPLAEDLERMERVLRRVESDPDGFWEVCL